jgi:hypothetical protein
MAAIAAALILLLVFRAQASAQDALPHVAEPAVEAQAARSAQKPLKLEVVEVGGETQRVELEGGWVMEVTPAKVKTVMVNGVTYQQVYDSIPYNRTEYLANPSYRHDTTVELMAGQLRPTVIHRTAGGERVVNEIPDLYRPYLPSYSDLWGNPGFRYFTPYLPVPPVLNMLPWKR